MTCLSGKRILLGITGSIAAYKSAFLTRELVKAGAYVRVIMTHGARDFITPLTLATLSRNPVLSDLIEDRESGVWTNHVDLALWADAMIIAPVSAHSLGKMVTGQSDNLLLLTFLSAKCPVFFAPSMDLDMFKHGSTRENIEKMQSFGHILIPVGKGELASGLEGEGRMAEPEEIIQQVHNYFEARLPLRGKKVLVTAGPTFERIDPVRFIGNFSSGKMGYAIAEELAQRGAEVTLVSGPTSLKTKHERIQTIHVESARDMLEACQREFAAVNWVIMSAAVADYRPAEQSDQKIKKTDAQPTVHLALNPDILKWMGQHKAPNQILVGFALETNNAVENARKKLKAKNLDLIMLNSLEDDQSGFGYDTNKVTLITADNKTLPLELKTKTEVARDLIDYLQQSAQ
ncbi:MAG: bifunctional phosphopantothenoylcysteine decarboxylase/phosphopantothenate--cysteine ligase CoaBC [Cryomorphaceae bacterium]|nr:MAG: bifunctional phosphopantothenoylcysteine decarboxylase/phosphopantothenate--cysteine ligase CoaBC [Cryomorphaceae bacterium]